MKNLIAAILCLACAYPALLRAEEAKPAAPAAPAADKLEAVKCEAGCSHCSFKSTKQCLPAIKIKDMVYVVTVSPDASEQTKKLVASLPDMKDGKSLNVKITGKILAPSAAEKAAVAANTDHKSWFEIGEISLEN